MNATRDQIVALLQAGLPDAVIARQLQAARSRVRRYRRELGIPPHGPDCTPAASPEEKFWRRAQPTDDGHLLWPGLDPDHGATIRYADRNYSIHWLAFRIGNQREPDGVVRSGCDQAGCVHPRHVEDQQMRDQYRAIFAA